MQLSDIRTEILAKGFNTNLFSAARLNSFINDGYQLICTRVQYYVDEATQDFTTTTGTSTYPFPTDFGRLRDLRDTNRNVVMMPISLRDMDNSGVPPQGSPSWYALDASNFHLWPIPDGAYPMECRYWKQPANLVNDTDVPIIPAKWHRLLWLFGCWQCYESEDDPSMGQYWENRFEKELSEFMADVKFVDSETPDVAKSFWDRDVGIQQRGWSVFGWW